MCLLCRPVLHSRYWAIHDPLNYVHKRTLRRVTSQILFVWLISAIISVPPLIGWNDWSFTGTEGPCELSNNKGYVVYSASGSFYIPLVIMSIVYLKIYLATRKRLRERANAAAKVSAVNVLNHWEYRGSRSQLAKSTLGLSTIDFVKLLEQVYWDSSKKGLRSQERR